MMTLRLETGSLAIVLLIGLSGSALVHSAGPQDRNPPGRGQYAGSPDARQHGYEHGYRDGADRGRQDRESGRVHSLKDNDYQVGAREYEAAFGDRNLYMNGYREGFQTGYEDGHNDRPGQYGQLYQRPGTSNQPPARDDGYGNQSWSAGHTAFDSGYRDGVTAGQQDRSRNMRSNYRVAAPYKNADLGYRTSYGDRDAYRLQYRDGFERGYQDGYGRSQYASDGGGYYPTPSRQGAIDTRDGRGTPQRSLIVPGNRQWTPTAVRVNQGDTFRFQVTGEIRFSPDANDRAVSAGSLTHKYVPGAPLPDALAGALIGRIDNGRPFGIGNLSSLLMPASGVLYLGINDDIVSDNSGEFQVVISW